MCIFRFRETALQTARTLTLSALSKKRTLSQRPSFTAQEAIFQAPEDHLLQAERRPFATRPKQLGTTAVKNPPGNVWLQHVHTAFRPIFQSLALADQRLCPNGRHSGTHAMTYYKNR